MAKEKKPTRNTQAQYAAKEQTVRYVYDAGDDRRAVSRQPKEVADEIIRVAVKIEEDGEQLRNSIYQKSWKEPPHHIPGRSFPYLFRHRRRTCGMVSL